MPVWWDWAGGAPAHAALHGKIDHFLIDPRKQTVVASEAVLSGLDTSAGTSTADRAHQVAGPGQRVIDRLGLADKPELFAKAMRAAAASRNWVGADEAPGAARSEQAVEQDIRVVQDRMEVVRRGFSFMLELSFTASNPGLAAAFTNGLAEEYLLDQLERSTMPRSARPIG